MKIKSYTDLKQSKNLSEILPIESADMYYKYVLPTSKRIQRIPEIGNPINSLKLYNEGYTFSGKKKPITLNEYCIPCWSLTALLNAIPSSTLDSSDSHHYRIRCNVRYSEWYENSIDACYNMILKLHELNIL